MHNKFLFYNRLPERIFVNGLGNSDNREAPVADKYTN